jgi:hypothetical protein
MDANFRFRARSINRSIGQCSTRSAGHGRVGLGAAGPDAINDIIDLGTANGRPVSLQQ